MISKLWGGLLNRSRRPTQYHHEPTTAYLVIVLCGMVQYTSRHTNNLSILYSNINQRRLGPSIDNHDRLAIK